MTDRNHAAVVWDLDSCENVCEVNALDGGSLEVVGLAIKGDKRRGYTVTGKVMSRKNVDIGAINGIAVSVHCNAPRDGRASLVGRVEFGPPFEMPLTFALPCGPSSNKPRIMDYSVFIGAQLAAADVWVAV